jgi:hypothetical protein
MLLGFGGRFTAMPMLAFPDETSRDQMRSGVWDSAAHRSRNGTYSFVGLKIAACASISSDVVRGANCCQSLVLFPCTNSLQIRKESAKRCTNIVLPDLPQSNLN